METAVLYQSLALLFPVKAFTDEDHDTHVTYDLPSPLPWDCKTWVEPTGICLYHKLIKRVRVCISTSDRFAGPSVIIVPIDEEGREWPLSSMHIDGFGGSPWTAFKLLGFALVMESN